jgi:hypothetical protein
MAGVGKTAFAVHGQIFLPLHGHPPGRAPGEALGIFRDLGDGGGEPEALNEKGTLHRASGDLAQAKAATSRSWNWPAPSPAPRPRRTRWPAWAAAP